MSEIIFGFHFRTLNKGNDSERFFDSDEQRFFVDLLDRLCSGLPYQETIGDISVRIDSDWHNLQICDLGETICEFFTEEHHIAIEQYVLVDHLAIAIELYGDAVVFPGKSHYFYIVVKASSQKALDLLSTVIAISI